MRVLFAFLLSIASCFGMENDLEQIVIRRPSGSDNNLQVSKYLESELSKLDLKVSRQEFTHGRIKCANIIGVKTGQLAETIVVGSHFDTVSNTPGADDNASGCVVNLAIARSLNNIKTKRTIIFVFFDLEEIGMIGSGYYVRNLKDKCVFMLNLDMVGYLSKSDIKPDQTFTGIFKQYPWAKSICLRDGNDASDQSPFQQVGIPAVFVHTGLHRNYHRPSDTVANLNVDGMKMIAEFTKDFVIALDKSDNLDYNFLDTFNYQQ